MYTPLVSVIIPVYNGSNYIAHAIDCALAQTYKNIEILVVNDGSNDNGKTDEVVQRYGDRVRYLKKENGGVSSALNYAISQMNGEWFSWLSHDDGYYPQKIEREIQAINDLVSREKTETEKIVIYCDNERIDKDGKVILKRRHRINNRKSSIDLILDNIYQYTICGCAVLIHKNELLRIGGFNEQIRTVSDAECFYRLIFDNCRYFFLDEVLVQSRQHKAQVGKTKIQLFQNEGDNLHIWMLNEILKRDEWVKPEYLIKFIGGVDKRGFPNATQAAIEKYKELYGTKGMYKTKMLLCKTSVMRELRTIIRQIYREIVVK